MPTFVSENGIWRELKDDKEVIEFHEKREAEKVEKPVIEKPNKKKKVKK